MPCIVDRQTSAVPIAFLSLATILLILSSLSVPFLDGIRLFRLIANVGGARRYVDFGVFGYCVVPIRGVIGFDSGILDGCSKAKIGYTINETITNALHTSAGIQLALTKAHTSALVLYPIVAALSLIVLLVSIMVWLSVRNPDPAFSMSVSSATITLIFSGVTTLLIAVTFAIGVSVMATVKSQVNQVKEEQGNLDLKWENVIWLSAVATFGHIYNMIFVCALRKQLKANCSKTAENPQHKLDPTSDKFLDF